ncbi:MAG: LysR family transcriptional regulator [Deltaproteobacteria bacterium]|nr:LysR family transcriptional regulator [Deltaproteobacteria bacterium]
MKIFQAVAKHGGFNRASKYLRLSQPAISINIKKLEEELGVELFERLGRSIQLTDAGRVVEEHVTRLTDVLSEMRQAIDEIKGLGTGQFRCGAATTIGIYLLPKILVQFKERFPKVETQFFSGRSSEIEKRVLSNDLDIGFVGSDLASSSRLRTHTFFTDELVIITPSNHYLARFRKVSPKRLIDLPLILGPKDSYTRKIIEKHLETAAIPYRCVMEVENTEVIKAAVSEGLGISILSLARIQREIKNGLLIPVRISGISIKRQFKVIMLKDKHLSRPTKAFLELLGLGGLYDSA